MNSLSIPTPSRRFTAVRVLLLLWFVYIAASTAIYLPSKFQRLSDLDYLDFSSGGGNIFEGWTAGQLRTLLTELGIRPVLLTATILSVSLICLSCYWGMGGILWSKSDTWIGLLAAAILISTGPGFSHLLMTESELPLWARIPYDLGAAFVWPTFFIALYLFPSGRFIPRFSRRLAILPYLLFVGAVLFPDSQPLNTIGLPIIFAFAFGGLVSQVYRYRKISTLEERQQTKWVVFALGIFISVLLLTPAVPSLFPTLAVATSGRFWFDFVGNGVVGILIPALLPLAMGVSILRYRLWDIDVIIRKTLVYAVLTGLLALVYFGTVVILQTLLGSLSGEQAPVFIVLSTLLTAALFSPLRRRVQVVIDRRFFRRKYDAAETLAAFGATARDEVELDALTAELLRVVDETMQPQRVSIWLREGMKDV